MNFSCLETGLGEVSKQLAAIERDDALSLILVSVVFALPLAPLVLTLYQRRVQKLMSIATSRRPAADVTSSPIATAGGAVGRKRSVATATLIEAADLRAGALWRALALAVAFYSVGIAAAITISPDAPGELSRRPLWEWIAGAFGYLLFVGSLAAPMVLLGVASTRFSGLFWKWFAPAYFTVVVLAMFADEDTSRADGVETFLQGIAILLVLYAGLGGRRMRNVVPLLSVILCLLILALAAVGGAMTLFESCVDEESTSTALAVSVVILAGFWAGWRTVLAAAGRLARAYEMKRFSDAQVQVGAWMAVITLVLAFAPGYTEAGLNLWSLGLIPPVVGALWLYRWQLSRIAPWKPARALLLLRVFARDKRGERLLDEVAFRWRFIGPIHMIGGPDLAQTNLEPNELLLFLRRRLGEIFVVDRASLQRRLASIDWEADPDARYRINETYCSDDLWQETVGKLVERSDAVLLDLRGFTAARRGTAFEIRLLAERDALKRSVILTDAQTDWPAVEQSIGNVPGAALSPERVVRVDRRVDGNELFALLAADA